MVVQLVFEADNSVQRSGGAQAVMAMDLGVQGRILLSAPTIGTQEARAVERVLNSGWLAPAGPEVDAFEADLVSFTGAEAALAVSSGSAGLELALRCVGVGRGDEVVVQSSTFAASAFSIVNIGARPVFCDIEFKTNTLDLLSLEGFLEKRLDAGATLPTAVLVVDSYGYCCDYDSLRRICERFGLAIVEDAAESLGSTYQGRKAGTLGDVGVLSFNGNKIISTGGGGALLGPAEMLQRARHWSTQAKLPHRYHYEHDVVAHNYRLSCVAAAIGRVQLQDLECRVAGRRRLNEQYRNDERLQLLNWFTNSQGDEPNQWLSVATLPEGHDPAELCGFLDRHNVDSRRAWYPMHLQPALVGYETISGAGAERLFSRGICLPSGNDLSDDQLAYVRDVLARWLGGG